MNPYHLLWIIPAAGAFGMAIMAMFIMGKESDR